MTVTVDQTVDSGQETVTVQCSVSSGVLSGSKLRGMVTAAV